MMRLPIENRRGLTLIEVLAVVVIVSLASAATMVRLSSANDDAALRAARAAIQDIDAKARLLGRTGRSIALTATDDHTLCIVDFTNPSPRLAQANLAAQMTAHLEIDATSVPRVAFDRLGRSDDYAVVLRRGDRVFRCSIGGLTGWTTLESGGA